MKKVIYPLFALVVLLQLVISPLSANAAEQVYFTEPKEGVYNPLHPNTLNWTGNVLVDGGYNLMTNSLYGRGEGGQADIVITSKEIGANAIIDLGANANLSATIERDQYRGWKTYFSLNYSTYLIKTHNNKFAKIKITDIQPNRVYFQYVLETDAPVQGDWRELPAKNLQPADKVWRINFSKEVDATSVHSQNVYVISESGIMVNVSVKVDPSNAKTVLVQPPSSGYEFGKSYTVYVQNIKEKGTSKLIKENVKMKFTIENPVMPVPLKPPSNVKYEIVDKSIKLTWTDSEDANRNDFNGYYIYISTNGVNYTKLTNSNNGSNIFKTNSVFLDGYSGKNVYIYVTAVDLFGNESINSNTVTVTPTPVSNAPIIFDTNAGDGWVTVDWYDIYDPNLLGYYLYISEGTSNEYVRQNQLLTVSNARINGLTNGVKYNFYVTAVYKSGESSKSNIVSETPTAAVTSTWEGQWSTRYGTINMVQSGNKVKGTYQYGTIEGTVEGNNLIGTFYESSVSNGEIKFTISSDGNSFDGKFKYTRDNINDWADWSGTRLK
ncbi:fibronectin type III domain-containing protein [Lysinibacillus endophyticus]|uniref:fibronectin type III domain-containing protein n=1 Tax=Ureibacillus endophyticus TaxID=1978490 RepID=UPI00209F34A2|nr:fibronectin type III domain-containing protein [Lysinibacillus endophyticus]MCP1143723.1 fibronectin type III domain-containing protein [Lysinibacillus endophyticus]